jgi:hypothetical protein
MNDGYCVLVFTFNTSCADAMYLIFGNATHAQVAGNKYMLEV